MEIYTSDIKLSNDRGLQRIKHLFASGILLIFVLNNIPIVKASQKSILRIASTSAPVDTGLLYVLNEAFQFKWGVFTNLTKMNIKEICKAIEKKEVDFVIINSPKAIEKLTERKLVIIKEPIMNNNIFLFGPYNDPCNLRGGKPVVDGLKALKECNWLYYLSSNDTAIAEIEKDLWERVGGIPGDSRFFDTPLDSREKLLQADKDKTYCLIDSGTFYANKNKLSGRLFCTGGKINKNLYFGCVISEEPGGSENFVSAMAYLGWLTSVEGQKIMKDFTKNGENIFLPATSYENNSKDK